MGSFCCKQQKRPDSVTVLPNLNKKYSWDKRKEESLNPQDFIYENLDGSVVFKAPGTINGEQFIIQNCNNSTIYLLDHINTVTIDDCANCVFILGAIKGSLFLRNCNSCTCIAFSGQFRTRDCRKLQVFLYCATQPIIEASTRISFGNNSLSYKTMAQHLIKSGLDLGVRNWETVQDFTPLETEMNWNFMASDVDMINHVTISADEGIQQCLQEWEVKCKTQRKLLTLNPQELQFNSISTNI